MKNNPRLRIVDLNELEERLSKLKDDFDSIENEVIDETCDPSDLIRMAGQIKLHK